MAKAEYTEQDIQDYAAGTFTGDIRLLEEYIAAHPAAQRLVQEYRVLYLAIGQQAEEPLSFDLADSVVEVIEKRAAAKEVFWSRVAVMVAVVLFVSGLGLCYNYFRGSVFAGGGENGLLLMSMMACIAFAVAFHFVEWRQKQRKFASF